MQNLKYNNILRSDLDHGVGVVVTTGDAFDSSLDAGDWAGHADEVLGDSLGHLDESLHRDLLRERLSIWRSSISFVAQATSSTAESASSCTILVIASKQAVP